MRPLPRPSPTTRHSWRAPTTPHRSATSTKGRQGQPTPQPRKEQQQPPPSQGAKGDRPLPPKVAVATTPTTTTTSTSGRASATTSATGRNSNPPQDVGGLEAPTALLQASCWPCPVSCPGRSSTPRTPPASDPRSALSSHRPGQSAKEKAQSLQVNGLCFRGHLRRSQRREVQSHG